MQSSTGIRQAAAFMAKEIAKPKEYLDRCLTADQRDAAKYLPEKLQVLLNELLGRQEEHKESVMKGKEWESRIENAPRIQSQVNVLLNQANIRRDRANADKSLDKLITEAKREEDLTATGAIA